MKITKPKHLISSEERSSIINDIFKEVIGQNKGYAYKMITMDDMIKIRRRFNEEVENRL